MGPSPHEPLPPWPIDGYEEATARIGKACYGLLLEEPRWVHRRVERFSVLSPELFHRSLSVDLTVPELFRDALEISKEQWAVPVATLPKQPLRNFDMRDEGGKSIPVVGKKINAMIAEQVLLTAAQFAGSTGGGAKPSPHIEEWLAQISGGDVKEAEEAIDQMLAAEEAGDPEARAILGDRRAVLLLRDLAERYLLVAIVGNVTKRQILKYGYEYPPTWLSPSLPQRLGWDSRRIESDVTAASRTASYHAEIVVPEELRIEGSLVYDAETPTVYAVDEETDRASLYVPSVPRESQPILLFAIRLERPGFPTVAFAVAWVTASILLVGALFGDLSSAAAPGATLSLLLAGSALFAGAVARSGEHQLVRSMVFLPRFLLVLNALAGLAAGAAVALDLCPSAIEKTWCISAAIAVVLACILSGTFYRAARPRR